VIASTSASRLARPPYRRFARFIVVGGIGFAIDAGVLMLALHRLAASVYAARALSFTTAVVATWLLNRVFVFDAARRGSVVAEYGRYFVTQVAGALTNLGVFVALIEIFPRLASTPVLPLAAGAILGAVVNFAGASLWVFRTREPGVD
jgi:putative flippase GtrA